MMCAMSASKDSERPRKATRARQDARAGESEGVLSQLPRTRPQRSSPRRAAARRASAAARDAAGPQDVAASQATASTRKLAATKDAASSARSNGRSPAPARKAVKTAKAAPKQAVKRSADGTATPFMAAEPAPRQGFECEGERTSGSVHPPGGAELVASAAEIVGEIAKAGILTGERLLKDVLSRLPLT
jgi:hypothetical protein